MTNGATEPLPRYRLVVAYDGAAYHGFQLQGPTLDTVAGRLEEALARVCPEGQEGGRVPVEGASRTDAGVHALGQVCAFSSRLTVPLERLPVAVNSHLPADISVLSAERVPPEFEPRRHARAKTYAYHLWRSRVPSPFWRDRALQVVQELDLDACRAALAPLEGRHDFAAFRDLGSSAKTTVRTITRVELASRPLPSGWPLSGEFITLRLTGDGFLYHMVRIILGTVLDVGWGRLPPLITRQALASGKRAALGPTAPAHGLWLEGVVYDEPGGDTANTVPGPEGLEGRGFEGFHFP
jgi:tRNA pseudouridine38-40 synthase